MKALQCDSLKVYVHGSRAEMGAHAASDVATEIKRLAIRQPFVRMIFAAAPSQSETLEGLRNDPTIPWQQVIAFHMDEYIGLPRDARQRFGMFLKKYLFDHVAMGAVNFLDTDANPSRYVELLVQAPIDIVILGVGENGHIAFNDPPEARFDDPQLIREVALDKRSREQQVHDKCFDRLQDVPTRAVTLTIPALLAGKKLFCVVPGPAKAEAIDTMLNKSISESCPASILRKHAHCNLYLDEDSFQQAKTHKK